MTASSQEGVVHIPIGAKKFLSALIPVIGDEAVQRIAEALNRGENLLEALEREVGEISKEIAEIFTEEAGVELCTELDHVLRILAEEGFTKENIAYKRRERSVIVLDRAYRTGKPIDKALLFTQEYPYDDEILQIEELFGIQDGPIVYLVTPSLRQKILLHLRETVSSSNPDSRTSAENPTQTKEIRLDEVDLSVARSLPKHLMERAKAVPVGFNPDGSVKLLMANPHNLLAIDDVRLFLKRNVVPIGVPEQEIHKLINAVWSANLDLLAQEEEPSEEEERLEDTEGPARLFLYSLLKEAIFNGVSDIHFDPEARRVVIRYRVDGVLEEAKTVAKSFYPSLLSVIKLMSGMDITERRMPQDGRLRYKDRTLGVKVDARVSTVAGVYGEKVVMRLLKQAEDIPELERLGFSKENYDKFLKIITKPYGMILITGPTGSGKSFTNFSVLKKIATPDKNTLTVEDPVEYEIPGITQVPVNPQIGVTFARVLRTFLRQDPDIIMVGEIRDSETAKIATEAALTGHLVLATLHTNDAAQAVIRLEQMGVERWNIGAALLGVLSQRLVRTLCPSCKAKDDNPENVRLLEEEGVLRFAPEPDLYKPVGCNECRWSGYKGRTAIHELLVVTPRIREAIYRGAHASEIKRMAIEEGMFTLKMDGLLKVARGLTTIEEVLAKTIE